MKTEQVKLYAFRPVAPGTHGRATKGQPTRKTPQVESLLVYENTKRVSEVETGVIYPTWDAAAKAIGEKNQELARSLKPAYTVADVHGESLNDACERLNK